MQLHTFQKGVSMKRTLQFVTAFAAAAMLNGCSKCSGNQPAETTPAAEAPAATQPAPTEGTPAEAGSMNAPAQGGEAAPAAPTEAK